MQLKEYLTVQILDEVEDGGCGEDYDCGGDDYDGGLLW